MRVFAFLTGLPDSFLTGLSGSVLFFLDYEIGIVNILFSHYFKKISLQRLKPKY